MKTTKLLSWFLFATALVALPGGAQADPVTACNDLLLDLVRLEGTSPPRTTRALALMNIAIFDAANGIMGVYEPYYVTSRGPTGSSTPAAAAVAGTEILLALYPQRTAFVQNALAGALAGIPDGQAKSDGIAWGEFVAAQILALRAGDGADTIVDYHYPTGGGWWAPTPPAFAPALLPNWPTVKPWLMHSGSQFRGAAPPSPSSPEYAAAFDEVRRVGRKNSRSRTAEQSQIALFWADGPGTVTPPGHWIKIAIAAALDQKNTVIQNARLFAVLGMTLADAAIVSWDNKYAYNHWRPVTAIQRADEDGNELTTPDPTWASFITTPPFPAYTSGHSTFSGAAAKILELAFGDAYAFATTSDGLPGVTRSFTSFAQAAEEAGQSRIYGGIHWQYDNQVGLTTGRALAEYAFFGHLQPLSPPGEACAESATTRCLADNRFKVEIAWHSAAAGGAAEGANLSNSSGHFWFFDADNTEILVKLLDGCAVTGHRWFFASGLTDVGVLITVTDTQSGKRRQYFNPRGRSFANVQDVHAFPCD